MRIVVTGADGQLGRDLAGALAGHEAVLLGRKDLDVTDVDTTAVVLESAMPDAIIHAAAWTDVDGCEQDPERAHRDNVEGTVNVVSAAGAAFVVVVSTDYVFDGTAGRAYDETDEPNPLQVYGNTKLHAERAATAMWDAVAVVRSAWLYGAQTTHGNFVTSILKAAASGPIEVVDDQVGSPTATVDLARALVALCEQPVAGTFHVVNEGEVSRAAFAQAILESAGMDPSLVRPVSTDQAPPRAAKRPAFAPLTSVNWPKTGLEALPPWRDALARVLPAIAR